MEALLGIGIGPLLTIIGLLLDGLGVILSHGPYAVQTNKDVAYETEKILTAEWSHDHTEAEWLATRVGRTRLELRRAARLGLFCLATGFFLQAIGTYLWASDK
jgi:ferredoxin-NADP reductase